MTLSASKSVLSNLHNKFQGERVFILGTGPSLDSIPDEVWGRLRAEHNFGVNLVANYRRLGYIPDLYAVSELSWWFNEDHINEVAGELRGVPPIKFYCWGNPIADRRFSEWVWVRSKEWGDGEDGGDFQGLGEEFPYVLDGVSVVTCAIQIACWLGFEGIYLLGCDASGKGHARSLNVNENDYNREPQEKFIEFCNMAERAIFDGGRALINLSEPSALEIKRFRIEDILGRRGG